MSTVATKPATLEDFLKAEAEAPDGARLALIDGEIVDWGASMTTRNARHSSTMARITYVLCGWSDRHPELQAIVATGEARCRLTKNPDRFVGLDVAVFLGKQHLQSGKSEDYFDGPPQVAVEILSGSDTHDDVVERIRILLTSGVRQVWIVDTELRRVTLNYPDGEAVTLTSRHELNAEPELPGLQVSVDSLFPG